MNISTADKDSFIGKVCELKRIIDELEGICDRHFTIDGHLAGSIGEYLAKYYYDIELSKSNEKTHDAVQGNKKIQIKMTQRDSVDISSEPEFLIVLKIVITSEDVKAYEVYNGPGKDVFNSKEMNKNNWKSFTLNQLMKFDNNVSAKKRISLREGRTIEKWKDHKKS